MIGCTWTLKVGAEHPLSQDDFDEVDCYLQIEWTGVLIPFLGFVTECLAKAT